MKTNGYIDSYAVTIPSSIDLQLSMLSSLVQVLLQEIAQKGQ